MAGREARLKTWKPTIRFAQPFPPYNSSIFLALFSQVLADKKGGFFRSPFLCLKQSDPLAWRVVKKRFRFS